MRIFDWSIQCQKRHIWTNKVNNTEDVSSVFSLIEDPRPVFTAQKDLVGVISTLSSYLLQDTISIVTLFWWAILAKILCPFNRNTFFSSAFVLGFVAREALSAEIYNSKSSSCENCDPKSKSFLFNTTKKSLISGLPLPSMELKRKIELRNFESKTEDLVSLQSTKSKQSNINLVTKPPRAYKLRELIPPSFYMPVDAKYSSAQSRPSTYQSYLVRKHGLKPHPYLKQVQVITAPPAPFDYSDNYSDKTVYENYVREADSQELQSDSDWKIHWISWREQDEYSCFLPSFCSCQRLK